ncbi:MAG: hypothetical protein JWM91_2259 [Rhodospirillales bacterium]|nr:hypothetical protein [Rhodospirillales bacterium]
MGAARDYVAMSVSDPGAGQVGCSLERLGEAIRSVVDSGNPPQRLLLGKPALKRIGEKHANVEADLETWRFVSEMVGQ